MKLPPADAIPSRIMIRSQAMPTQAATLDPVVAAYHARAEALRQRIALLKVLVVLVRAAKARVAVRAVKRHHTARMTGGLDNRKVRSLLLPAHI